MTCMALNKAKILVQNFLFNSKFLKGKGSRTDNPDQKLKMYVFC